MNALTGQRETADGYSQNKCASYLTPGSVPILLDRPRSHMLIYSFRIDLRS